MPRVGFPRHATVAAYLALVLSLSGTAYAISKVTGADVVNETLTGADVLNGSLTGVDIRDGSLTAVDWASTPGGSSLKVRDSEGSLLGDFVTNVTLHLAAPVTSGRYGIVVRGADGFAMYNGASGQPALLIGRLLYTSPDCTGDAYVRVESPSESLEAWRNPIWNPYGAAGAFTDGASINQFFVAAGGPVEPTILSGLEIGEPGVSECRPFVGSGVVQVAPLTPVPAPTLAVGPLTVGL